METFNETSTNGRAFLNTISHEFGENFRKKLKEQFCDKFNEELDEDIKLEIKEELISSVTPTNGSALDITMAPSTDDIIKPVVVKKEAPKPTNQKVVIPDKMFFRIGDVSDLLGVKAYVLRYWETEFPTITPEKSSSGQRVYKRADVETLLLIKHLLYDERYSIEGARRRIRELKKEGELKKYKQENVIAEAFDTDALKKRMKQLRTLTADLQKIVRTPLGSLFKL